MSNHFSGTGNLGAAPLLKNVEIKGESRPVAEMRIFFDRRTRQDDGTYGDDGGFWVTANLWGWRGEAAARLLTKGARVFARGRLRTQTWEDDQGTRAELQLDMDYLALDLLGIETVTTRAKAARNEGDPE